MAKELLRIIVMQENDRAPITKIFENGVEVKTYTKFTFSVADDEVPTINGEKVLFDPEYKSE